MTDRAPIPAELAALRSSIDNLDASLVFILSERFKLTKRVGKLKASNEWDIKSEQRRLAYRSTEAERAETLYNRQSGSAKARDEALTEKELAEFALSKAQMACFWGKKVRA